MARAATSTFRSGKDAKLHAIGAGDLHTLVDQRIERNEGRGNLYPLLRDGFLLWWDRRRRWTNRPFEEVYAPRGRYIFPEIQATVKIGGILAIRDGRGVDRYVYPYFSLDPELSERFARLGLWLISQAIPTVPIESVRILDVFQGQTFSTDRHPLRGNERAVFLREYRRVLDRWNELRDEYD